jgi:RsiW-degrading membrane proteinase PrsW (M82 family)
MAFHWLLGFIPGLIWLLMFLYRDRKHPEPKKMIGKVFLWGAAVTILALGVEAVGFKEFGDNSILYIFLVVAPAEEILKWLVFKLRVERNKNYDEPIDAMIYMITIGLGFATVENIILIINATGNPLDIIVMRFLSATLLHALASGTVGYFIGSKKPVVFGLILAIIGHATYNYFATIGGNSGLAGIAVILISMFVLVSWFFKKLKVNT